MLITTAIGKVKRATEDIGRIRGVRSVHAITGPYGLIAFIEAKEPASIVGGDL